MQMPSIQPADVFTPIKEAGQAAGNALANVGQAVDTYNYMVDMLKKKQGRAILRAQLIKEAGLNDEDLPKDMTAEQLTKFSNKVNTLKAMMPDITKYKVASAPEKRLISVAAGADDDSFWKLAGILDQAIRDKKGKEEVSAESGRLQDVSAGLQGQNVSIEMPSAGNFGNVSGPQSPTGQKQQDFEVGLKGQKQAESTYLPGVTTREGAIRTAESAGVDWEKTGEPSRQAFEKQFRSESDIAATISREKAAETGGSDKSQEKMTKLENEVNGLKKLKIEVRNFREKLKDKNGSVSQQMIQSLAASDPEFAKIVGTNADPAVVEQMLDEHDASVSRQIISKSKQFNTYAPADLDMKIGEYVDFVASVEKKYSKGKKPAPGAVAPPPAAEPSPGATAVDQALKAQYEAGGGKPGVTFEQYKAKAVRMGVWDGIVANYKKTMGL